MHIRDYTCFSDGIQVRVIIDEIQMYFIMGVTITTFQSICIYIYKYVHIQMYFIIDEIHLYFIVRVAMTTTFLQ